MSWSKAPILLLIATPVWAVEGYIIGGGIEADSADGVSAAVIGNVAITEKTWLGASYARNSVDLPRGITLETDYADIGVDHHFDPVGIRLEAAYWGDSDILDSLDGRASIYWRKDRLSISGDAEYRHFEFDIPPNDFVPRRDIAFHANGWGLSGRYEFNDMFSMNLSGIRYDYNVRLNLGDNAGIIDLLSVSRLSLINSLIDYRVGGGLGLDVGEQRWNFDYRRWKNSADGSITHSTTARFLTPMGTRGDFELGIGVDDSELYGSVTFLSVFFYFYGGP